MPFSTKMKLLEEIKNSKGEIAVLIDPEKTKPNDLLVEILNKINETPIKYIFVGGSTEKKLKIDELIIFIKQHTTKPIIIFPGHHTQISKFADGILFLSLLTSKNPKYLIEEQLKSAPLLNKTKLEIIPTGYFLLDENGVSSTSKITKEFSKKINKKELLNLSLTAKYLGKEILLFDKGSGSDKSFKNNIINEIKEKTNLPLIVGGGIKSTKEIINLKNLGVNIIIVGNYIEKKPDFLDELKTLNLV